MQPPSPVMSAESHLPPLRSAPAETFGGRWEVQAALTGAMGTVLLLVDPATGRRLAAKTPRVERELAPETLRRFQAEARTWMALGHHENVVEAFFLEEIEWRGRVRPFLFLEFVDGPTLDAVLRREGRLAVPVALDVATAMAWGMAHAHGEGRTGPRIVHRDLKPENVFLTRDRVLKVSDFGIARALDRPEDAASEGTGLGTPYYAAPEQMKDARAADVRSDVYSFGAVVHTLLVGEPPFPAPDLSTLVFKVLREEPRPPSSLVPGVPPALDRLVLACLAKHPSARPESFTKVLEEISEIREIDELWAPPAGARTCGACGWLVLAGLATCTLCGKRTGRGERYAPVSSRSNARSPTLGRHATESKIVVEGVQVRPRAPRAGDHVVVTLLLGNPGSEPVEKVTVPFSLPDRDAFALVDGGHRRGFRGTVPPTAGGAPLRVSWTIRPLREGKFRLRPPRAARRARGDGGRRHTVRGEPVELVVEPPEGAPLIGRDAEVADLRRRLDDATAGRSSLALVLGQPGSGKTRLGRELAVLAETRGFVVARGRCLDRGVEVRGALKEALRQLLGLRRGAKRAEEIAARAVEVLGTTARTEPHLLQFLVDELLGRPVARGESTAHMWARFAAAYAHQRPLVLVLEDVQRERDVAAIAVHMVRHARRENARFVAVLSARPEFGSGAGAEIVRRIEEDAAESGLATVLRLGPLTADACRTLVDAVLSPNDFDTTAPWLVPALAELSGGNPLYLSGLLRTLQERADDQVPLVVPEGGRWTATAALTYDRLRRTVPERLEELAVARLHEFTPEVRVFATAAAVLGDSFETDVLRSMLGDPSDFETSLAELERAGVLREVAGDPPRIRFREPIFPEILDRQLCVREPHEHARLHRLAADQIRARPQARGRNALLLGRHLRAAGDAEAAFPALLDAARRLQERQAYGRAAAVLADAADLLRDGARARRADRVEFALLRGEALRFTGDYAGALEAYRGIVDSETMAKVGEEALASVYSKMGKVHEALGQLDDAVYCYAVGLSLRQELGRRQEVPLSMVNLAGLHLLRGETDRATAYLDEAVELAAAASNHRALGRAYVLRARILVMRGETRAVRPLVRGGLREARLARDKTGTADAWTVLGHSAFREGRSLRAQAHFRRALHIRQEVGDVAAVGGSWSDLGAAFEAAGDISAAIRAYRRAADIARGLTSVRGLAIALANLGRVELEAGHPRRALEILTEALLEQRRAGNPGYIAVTLADIARAERCTGEIDVAARHLDEARQVVATRPDHDLRAYVALAGAEAHAAAGRLEAGAAEARAALEKGGVTPDLRVGLLSAVAEMAHDLGAARAAVSLAERSTSAWSRARSLVALGRVLAASGEVDEAASVLRRGVGQLLHSGSQDPFLLAALLDQARVLERADPAAAAAARDRARELAAELQARGYVARHGSGFPLEAPSTHA